MGGAGIGRSSGGLNAADRAKLANVPADTASAIAAKADKAGATLTGATVDEVTPAQFDLIANGAKATATLTLIAFGTWATGNTVVVPGLASFTIQVDATPGDLDLQGMDEATAKAAIDAYITTNSTLVSAVTTGDSMVLTAKAYDTATNRTAVTGTLFTADGVMDGGLPPQISNPMPSNQQPRNIVVYDAAVNGADVLIGGLSSAKRYRIVGVADNNGAGSPIFMRADSNSLGGGAYYFPDGNNTTYCMLTNMDAGDPSKAFTAVIEPRRGGLSGWSSNSHSGDATGTSWAVFNAGAFSVDFTSIQFVFDTNPTARTGWLTVIEETP